MDIKRLFKYGVGVALIAASSSAITHYYDIPSTNVMTYENDDGTKEIYIIHQDKVYGDLEKCMQEPPAPNTLYNI